MSGFILLSKKNGLYSKWLLILCLLPALWSCGFSSGIFEPGDSAPRYHVDVNSIPDAVPKNEPLSQHGNPASYNVMGRNYYVKKSSEGYVERGVASWYGTKFHGRKTSSGEIYDTYGMTAAHKSLPLPTYVRVTNLHNHRSIIVKVNDRGPFVRNRLIDLSYAAAKKLGITEHGTGLVEVRAITPEIVKTYPHTYPYRSKTEISATRPDVSEKLYIQVAAFQDHQNAQRLRNELKYISASEISIQEVTQNRKPIYRVRIGPLASMRLADELTDLLSQRGLTGSRIITD